MRELAFCVCLFATVGCADREYVLVGKVKDAITGEPIDGATVVIAGTSIPGHRTTADGDFAYYIDFSPKRPNPQWKLKLSADGYKSDTIEIGPVVEADDDPVYIFVHLCLRPTTDEPSTE